MTKLRYVCTLSHHANSRYQLKIWLHIEAAIASVTIHYKSQPGADCSYSILWPCTGSSHFVMQRWLFAASVIVLCLLKSCVLHICEGCFRLC